MILLIFNIINLETLTKAIVTCTDLFVKILCYSLQTKMYSSKYSVIIFNNDGLLKNLLLQYAVNKYMDQTF